MQQSDYNYGNDVVWTYEQLEAGVIMAIRSAQTFNKGYKPLYLKGIIPKLSLPSMGFKKVVETLEVYHRKRLVVSALKDHLLIDLRDAVNNWSQTDPKEFARCHGPELLAEVRQELSISSAEHLDLVGGDILFRWVPKGINQFGALQGTIANAQDQIRSELESRGQSTNQIAHIVLQHVGIYTAKNKEVVEIGGKGLMYNDVVKREHYDLVVRSRQYGPKIEEKALAAQCGPKYYLLAKYPVWDLFTGTMPALVANGGKALPFAYYDLARKNTYYTDEQKGNILQQRVICSHFVNAVLYAAIWPINGTIATATDHKFDGIFKIGPAQIWYEFMNKIGIWLYAQDAKFVGLQHKGNLDRNIDPRKLGVGLTQPPIPKTEGRAPLAPPLPNDF